MRRPVAVSAVGIAPLLRKERRVASYALDQRELPDVIQRRAACGEHHHAALQRHQLLDACTTEPARC